MTHSSSLFEGDIISFTKVALPYGWLGNMSRFAIVYENKEYRTTEALFQALRFSQYPEIAEGIRAQVSPMGAKMQAKKHKDMLEKSGYVLLGEQDISYMKLCLQLKLAQHPQLTMMLTDTGKAALVEDCSKRPHGSGLFWGAEYKDGVWHGTNMLGQLWMQERQRCQSKIL